MTKSERRKRMKALAIADFIIAGNIEMLGLPKPLRFQVGYGIAVKAQHMGQIPAILFRHDKPKLDKRRYKRYQQKQMKGAFLTPNNASHTAAHKKPL